MIEILTGDNKDVIPTLVSRPYQLIYLDPPREETYDAIFRCGVGDLTYLRAVAPRLDPNRGVLVIFTNIKNRSAYERYISDTFSYLKLSQEIIWHYDFGTYTRARFVPSHDNILIYTVGEPLFNWESIAITSQRQQSDDARADQRGRVPGTVWSIPRVPGNSRSRRILGESVGLGRSQHPVPLVERIVKAYTKPGDWIMDPFAGTGTTLWVCKYLGRNCTGIEINPAFAKQIQDRLSQEQEIMSLREDL